MVQELTKIVLKGQSWNNLSKKNERVLNYNPNFKVNAYEST